MTRGNKHDGRGAAQVRALSGHMDDWEDLAVDYMDGQVDGETRAAMESHLRDCPACAARLHVQQQVFTLLKETPLDDPPPELENRFLGELSFSPTPAIRAVARPRTEEPSRGWSPWFRKIGPWVPATVGIAAVLFAVVTYGMLSSGASDSAQTTTLADSVRGETADDNGLQEAAPTYSGADTTAAAAAGTTATTAAGTETTMAPVVGMTAGAGATETTYAPYTDATAKAFDGLAQDEMTMAADLEAAEVPAYFVFEGADPAVRNSAETTAAFVDQITLLTGIPPLDSTLSLDGPTFAAYLPRDDASQFVDLLRSVGASLGLTVSLDTQPPDEIAGGTARLLGRKTDFPVLSSHRTSEATDSNRFSTSPLEVDPGQVETGTGEETAVGTPDEAGTHVLIVIYVKN
jgi:hypothetical protein